MFRKFAHGGVVDKSDDDKVSVVLSRGWWCCKKCGAVFESFAEPPVDHICEVKNCSEIKSTPSVAIEKNLNEKIDELRNIIAIERNKTKTLKAALKLACKIGFSDDCPKHNLDVEPFGDCPERCTKNIDISDCWFEYFVSHT